MTQTPDPDPSTEITFHGTQEHEVRTTLEAWRRSPVVQRSRLLVCLVVGTFCGAMIGRSFAHAPGATIGPSVVSGLLVAAIIGTGFWLAYPWLLRRSALRTVKHARQNRSSHERQLRLDAEGVSFAMELLAIDAPWHKITDIDVRAGQCFFHSAGVLVISAPASAFDSERSFLAFVAHARTVAAAAGSPAATKTSPPTR